MCELLEEIQKVCETTDMLSLYLETGSNQIRIQFQSNIVSYYCVIATSGTNNCNCSVDNLKSFESYKSNKTWMEDC